MRTPFVLVLALGAGLLAHARDARAQYKNSSFGLDAGYWLISKPTILDPDGEILPIDKRPLRLANGYRIGGETNFKMDQDHWWLTIRLDIAFMQYSADKEAREGDPQANYDRAAKEALGTLMGVEGQMGVRYFVLTDRFRPYMQLGLSYMRLFSFSSSAESTCTQELFIPCGDDGGSNERNFMPHPNVGGVHFQPGVEVIVSRDIALHLFADLQHWFVINASDNNAVVLGFGFNFYT